MAATIALSTHEIQGLCRRYLTENHNVSASHLQHGFKVLHYDVKPISDAPAGFLGRHQFLCVAILHDAKDNYKQQEEIEKLRFFIKSAPTDVASSWQYLEEFGVFKKEIVVYRDVLPILQQCFTSVAPKCYYADNNMLVFENLTQQNFKMAAARDGLLNYEHLHCLLKTLAAMHASSIVYEVRHGKTIAASFPEAVVENAYPRSIHAKHVRVQNFNNANKVLCEMIKLMPQYQQNLLFILKEFPCKMRTIFELAQQSIKYQNVFSHGDLWANNVMFRYGKFGEIPMECRFVDFQLARYAPAILDVITILTIPTSRVFRARYLDELICEYYSFIGEFLRREQLDIENFMPKQQFFDSVEEFRIAGLIESCLFSHLTILPPRLTIELTGSADGFSDFFEHRRVDICMEAFRTDQMYCERMTDMIEDLVDNFVLKQ